MLLAMPLLLILGISFGMRIISFDIELTRIMRGAALFWILAYLYARFQAPAARVVHGVIQPIWLTDSEYVAKRVYLWLRP